MAQEPPRPPLDALPCRLVLVAEAAAEALDRAFAERHGVAGAEWRVIAAMDPAGRTTASAIGRAARLHKTKVSRALALLDGKGLIERSPNPTDRREALVGLTAEGRAVHAGLAAAVERLAARWTASLDRGAADALESGLAALGVTLGAAPGAADGGPNRFRSGSP